MGTKSAADVWTGKILAEGAGTLWDRRSYGLAEKSQRRSKGTECLINPVGETTPVPVPPEKACTTHSIMHMIHKSVRTGKAMRIRQA